MKKIILLLFLFIDLAAYCQDYQTLHNRYWYYRTRLRNDFMKVGLTHGCSIPMEERGETYAPTPDASSNFDFSDPNSGEAGKWGDAMGELGYYIGVLATEYNLLSRNNQETDSVRYEFYCALQALNRMDYYAEAYFTQANGNTQNYAPSFNGFMLRDDVPIDFVQNNLKDFNYFGNRGFCSKVKIKNISTTSGNGAIQQGRSNYGGSYISQDNWINCIVGLALVRKFVPSGVNYKNMSFMDGNGPDINQEAFSIALRALNYFKQNPLWLLKYPNGDLIGSDWGGIGTGLAFPHAEALNKMDQNKWGNYVQPGSVSFNTACDYNNWLSSGNIFERIYKTTIALPLKIGIYAISSHSSGWLGDTYTHQHLSEAAYKAQLYLDQSNPDVAVQVANLSAVCNCEYTFAGVYTKSRLQLHINHHEIWHPELLRVALHGEGNCSATSLNMSYFNAAVSLLSTAPCYGPAKWDENGNDNSNHEWDTQTRLDHPESRNGKGWPGEYNGIDYMLYHNLVTIIDMNRNGTTNTKQMVDLGRRHITTNYPVPIGSTTWGTTTNPATIKSYEYITANNTVGTPYFLFTDVSYLAGKEITLGDGFSTTGQGYFTAAIQHFECNEILTNPINPSLNARTINNDIDSNTNIIAKAVTTLVSSLSQ